VLARGESFAKKFNAKPAVSLGDMIRCAITGRGTSAVKAALGEDQNASGGFLVPIETGRQLIDLARAKSVLVQAGAATVEMESDRLTIARVKTDPTMEVKEENQAFTATDFTFEAVGFTAHTIGCLIYASRELAADAPNFSVQVESVITAALGAELDRLGLVGSGSQEPLGIANYPRVGTTGSIGAIAWEDVHTAATGVRAANGEPNAWVAHPTIAGDLEILTSGDGTNSAKLWLGPPPGVAELAKFTTTNVTTANLIVGDFSKMLIGLRQRPMVEFSPVAGDAFAKHQIAIKVTWRGDFGLSQPTHFHVLSGITT
jgi:HK97 family phage major capsid protein